MTSSHASLETAWRRRSVDEFFNFRIKEDEPKPRDARYKAASVTAIIAALTGLLIQGAVLGVVLMVLVAGVAIYIERHFIQLDYASRMSAYDEERAAHRKLADITREVQAADVVKALLRVSERTMIDRDDLATLDQRYIFDKEESLFKVVSFEEKLGDLLNKSIRMISVGDLKKNAYLKLVSWTTLGEEIFFNPIRLVTIFLTDRQLIVCDVVIDSIDGDLQEEIQRISLSKVVNVHFAAGTNRETFANEAALKKARALGRPKIELTQMEKEIAESTETECTWVQEESTSMLKISRSDGAQVEVPIRSEIFFGRRSGALDRASLSESEKKIDRMVNELNRRVNAYSTRADSRLNRMCL